MVHNCTKKINPLVSAIIWKKEQSKSTELELEVEISTKDALGNIFYSLNHSSWFFSGSRPFLTFAASKKEAISLTSK